MACKITCTYASYYESKNLNLDMPARVKNAVTGAALRKPVSTTFDVKRFCRRYKVVRPDLTRLTGYSLRSVDKWAAGDKPSAAAQKQLKEMVRLFDAFADLMETNYVGEWLKTPNEAFEGSTPLQVIERGENDRLWRMIHEVRMGTLA